MIRFANEEVANLRTRPPRDTLALVAAALLAAGTIHACALRAAHLSGYPRLWRDRDALALHERNEGVARQARAQAVALTSLARLPGAWSVRMEGAGVQVVSKGGVDRAIPRPTALDLPHGQLGSWSVIQLREGVPTIAVGRAAQVCGALLHVGDLLGFASGPLEYSLSEEGGWRPYGAAFSCDAPRDEEDQVRLRPATAAVAGPGAR